MRTSQAIIALVAVLAVIASGANEDAAPAATSVANLFQNAYDTNPDWENLPYRTQPQPVLVYKSARDPDGTQVVVLRAFIDIFMNQVRTETEPSDLSLFVDKLPFGPDHIDIEPRPYVSHPSPQHSDPMPNVFEAINSFLHPPEEPELQIESPLITAAKIVLTLFGSMLRDTLYPAQPQADDETDAVPRYIPTTLDQQSLTSFVRDYVSHMTKCDVPEITALAMLARDLILAERVTPTIDEILEASEILCRYVVIFDDKLDLSVAATLMSATPNYKLTFRNVDMPQHVVLDLFVYSLENGHQAMYEYCERLSGKFAQNGVRMAEIIRQTAMLMAVTNTEPLVEQFRQPTDKQMGMLANIALFLYKHKPLIAELSKVSSRPSKITVEDAVKKTVNLLGTSQWYLKGRDFLPALVLLDSIKETLPELECPPTFN